ncbi:hypothetical protein [Roseisolibacter sp. H3M3-2]|uniref:hypothetical protein n=1 Tax=Roseisolibacter sp. H3M3-2 TaxID=3031323 RepID=UPI0023DB67D9|nr:hypothetical protein [Roseisolibacter sp. H3M3-2]MDF1502921.1 hypothetical protein [Roseisolibacter sp. H3M3-2]
MKARAFSPLPAAPLLPWPAILLGGSALTLLAAAALAGAMTGRPAMLDEDLARLLRAMTLLKGVLQLLGLGALAWRFRRPVAPAFAAGYLACAWGASAALGLMWRQAAPATSAVLLHGAAVVLLVLASRDPDFFPRPAGGRP